ncbi:hypothetical protein N7468_010005 [Penicillium chermesinum]|uniref:Uncharacterized protein n=1 Tax=Penicillium chermesinum TaxID=63820 RepID=A0A9W9NBV2_9EURO|nr:uncharacterized protein N7468_010005 [Penicillium chermesinum]KAJ5216997.1 hypothetical protein N7468_010005 [Penicillium chermesinum]
MVEKALVLWRECLLVGLVGQVPKVQTKAMCPPTTPLDIPDDICRWIHFRVRATKDPSSNVHVAYTPPSQSHGLMHCDIMGAAGEARLQRQVRWMESTAPSRLTSSGAAAGVGKGSQARTIDGHIRTSAYQQSEGQSPRSQIRISRNPNDVTDTYYSVLFTEMTSEADNCRQ